MARKKKRSNVERRARIQAAVEETSRRLRDVGLAHERIGTTPETRSRWLLEDFVARDPALLSTGELAILRDNLQALAGHGGLPVGPPDGAMGSSMSYDDPVLVNDKALRAVWERVVALTRAHRDPVVLPPRGSVFGQLGQSGPYIHLGARSHVEGLADQVVSEAARVLQGCERLRVCPECDGLFVARRRQERHPQCARKARDRRRPSRRKKGA